MAGGIVQRASSGKSAAAARHGRKDKQVRKEKRDRLKKRIASKKGKEVDRGEESGSEGMDESVPGVSGSGDVAGTFRPLVSVPQPSFNTSGFIRNMDPLGSTSNPMEVDSDDPSEEGPHLRRQSTAAGKKPAVVPARDPAPPITPVRKSKSYAERHAEILAKFQTPTKPRTPKELAAGQFSNTNDPRDFEAQNTPIRKETNMYFKWRDAFSVVCLQGDDRTEHTTEIPRYSFQSGSRE
ncbi:hypothetical protein MMC07_009292 [Pseudocyphellaria aurata]|nr:hypothetical protein [Pseudocyphellaria aurata]